MNARGGEDITISLAGGRRNRSVTIVSRVAIRRDRPRHLLEVRAAKRHRRGATRNRRVSDRARPERGVAPEDRRARRLGRHARDTVARRRNRIPRLVAPARRTKQPPSARPAAAVETTAARRQEPPSTPSPARYPATAWRRRTPRKEPCDGRFDERGPGGSPRARGPRWRASTAFVSSRLRSMKLARSAASRSPSGFAGNVSAAPGTRASGRGGALMAVGSLSDGALASLTTVASDASATERRARRNRFTGRRRGGRRRGRRPGRGRLPLHQPEMNPGAVRVHLAQVQAHQRGPRRGIAPRRRTRRISVTSHRPFQVTVRSFRQMTKGPAVPTVRFGSAGTTTSVAVV